MKLSQLRVHDILFDHTEGEFIPEAIQSITHSTWNHVKRIHSIKDFTPDGIFISEAISAGYKMRSLRESTGENDKYTLVCRYNGDGVGGRELTEEQRMRISNWDNYYLSHNISYGFAQIAALAILKQVRNDSISGMYFGRKFKEIQREIEIFLPQFICSEAVYRSYQESNIKISVLKDSSHMEHYSGGDVLDRYTEAGKDLLKPVIEDWLSPHDIFESPDVITMDMLDYSWRKTGG